MVGKPSDEAVESVGLSETHEPPPFPSQSHTALCCLEKRKNPKMKRRLRSKAEQVGMFGVIFEGFPRTHHHPCITAHSRP